MNLKKQKTPGLRPGLHSAAIFDGSQSLSSQEMNDLTAPIS